MHLHQTHQERSKASQERLLDAALALLGELSWEDISIATIAQRAGMSVGGFYARFKSKDAMLLVLHQRYEANRSEHFARFFDSMARQQPLAERLSALVDVVADWMHEHRGLLRTLLLRFWARPEDFDGAFGEHLSGIYRQAADLLIGDGSEIRRSKPDQAVGMVIVVLTATCREALVLKPAPNPGALEQTLSSFKRELVAITASYLGISQIAPDNLQGTT